MKKDRSSSGGTLEFPGSPYVSRRSHKEKQPSYSRLRLNPNMVTPAQLVELTVFHIPGLDVKVCTSNKSDEVYDRRVILMSAFFRSITNLKSFRMVVCHRAIR